MRRGVRFPAWYLLLVAVLTEALSLELRRPPESLLTATPPTATCCRH
jgi:hypothetical protein